jgi:hypothetical protein
MKFNPQAATALKSLQAGINGLNLVAFDVGDTTPAFVTNLTAVVEPLGTTTIDRYVTQSIADLGKTATKIERSDVKIDRYAAVRVVAHTPNPQVPITQLFYLIPQADRLWVVIYSTSTSQFERRLPQFEQSIQTIFLDNVAN